MGKKLMSIVNFKGFTLLECLIGLFVTGGICFLFSLLVSISQQIYLQLPTNNQREFYTFLFQLEQLAAPYQKVSLHQQELTFSAGEISEKEKLVDFTVKQRGERLDKTIGTQPLLTGVKSFETRALESEIEIRVVFQDGKESQGSYVFKKYQSYV